MKFTSTDINHIDEVPTQDSIIAVTDDSLLAYCADNTLHKVTKPEWHVVDEPNIGLIRDGILNGFYANKLDFGSNNGASSCVARQEETAYRLSTTTSWEAAWIRWKIDFDKVDYVDVKWQLVSGFDRIEFRISDGTYNPASSSWNSYAQDAYKIYSESITAKEYTVNVSKYTGVHWMYIHTNYLVGSYNLFDVELRKANES